MEKFNFISDEKFRENLENDYGELEKCLKNNCFKSVLILSGSIIEAILIDYLLSLNLKDIKKDELLKWDLNKAISKCKELKIISEKSKNLSDVVRNYRNLIHPGRAIRTKSLPEENDAIVANSLVEIIIKEIGERKQESYGYTAEQLLNKVEKDTTSEVIWHHFIKKINTHEKKRLLLRIIPNRYFDIYNSLDVLEDYPEEDFLILRKFFKTVYGSVEEGTKKEVAYKFVEIIHEGSSLEVSHYLESFFNIDFFESYDSETQQLVKEHLFGFIKKKIYSKLVDSIKGISKYLSNDEFNDLLEVLLMGIIKSSDRQEISAVKVLLDNEYQNSDKEKQKYILDFLDEKKDAYDMFETIGEKIQDVRNYLTDLPF